MVHIYNYIVASWRYWPNKSETLKKNTCKSIARRKIRGKHHMREAFKNIAKHICAKHFFKSIAYTVNFANAIIDLSHRPGGVSAWRPPGLSAPPPQGSLEQLFHCASVAHVLREGRFRKVTIIVKQTCPHSFL